MLLKLTYGHKAQEKMLAIAIVVSSIAPRKPVSEQVSGYSLKDDGSVLPHLHLSPLHAHALLSTFVVQLLRVERIHTGTSLCGGGGPLFTTIIS
jgi:hypothetical protein